MNTAESGRLANALYAAEWWLQWGRRMNTAESAVGLRAPVRPIPLLQWGRRMNTAESWKCHSKVTYRGELQWGRRMNTAESEGPCLRSPDARVASMGPP